VNGSGKIDAMKPSISKLQKFLQLEADRGYDNRAVMGGLERMLNPWEAEARAESVSEDFIQAVVARLRDYSRLSENSRAEALEGLWRRIQREGNISLPPLSQFEKRPEDASPTDQKRASKSYPSQPQKRAVPEHGGDEEQVPSTEAAQENGAPTAKMQTRTAPAPVRAPRTQAPPGPAAALDASVTVLPGVGPSHGPAGALKPAGYALQLPQAV
jgi:ATP-dependent DNA helicase RecG